MINNNSNEGLLVHLIGVLGVHIHSGEPAAITGMGVVPAEHLLASTHPLHRFNLLDYEFVGLFLKKGYKLPFNNGGSMNISLWAMSMPD